MTKTNRLLVVAALASGLFTGCDANDGDDERLRQIEQQLEDANALEDEVSGILEACEEDYGGCLAENLDDPDACSDVLDACLGGLPDPEELPEPEIPEIPDDFGTDCVDGLWGCIEGGADPLACSGEVQTCLEDQLGGICDAAYDACIDAGAPASSCDAITASCVIP